MSSAQSDARYQAEIGERRLRHWLRKATLAAVFACLIAALIEVGLIFWVGSQCTTILGLTLSGRVVPTDSLTCPIPGVAKLYPHAQIDVSKPVTDVALVAAENDHAARLRFGPANRILAATSV